MTQSYILMAVLCSVFVSSSAAGGTPSSNSNSPPTSASKTSPSLNSSPSKTAPRSTSTDVQPTGGVLPIDQLQDNLTKHYKSKTAQTLKQAYQALLEEDYSGAIRLAAKTERDESFSDYKYWITASAYQGLAGELIVEKKFKLALQPAQKAVYNSLLIESRTPYSPFIKSIPKELAKSEFLMADAYWGSQQWKKAQQFYEKSFQRLQSQNLLVLVTPDNLRHYAESCKKSQGPLCIGWLQKFAISSSKKSEEAKAVAAYFPDLAEKPKSYRPTHKVDMTYKAPDLDQAAFDAAMKLYFDDKFDQAAKGLRQFLDDFPRSSYRYKGRYWLAQALTHEQEHEKAQKMYEELQIDSPASFYGLLASTNSGRPIDLAIDATLPMASDTDSQLSPQEIIHLQRAKNFIAEKAYGLAGYELKDLKHRDGLSSPFLVYLAMLHHKSRSYRICFQIIGDLIQRSYPGILSSYGLRMIFPLDYLELIKKHSDENGLDPILVLSLIKQESAFTPDVSSSAGAMGLMQLMPATASDTSPEVHTADLVSPDENIRVGTKYLKKLLTRFNGNIVLALAGYNAGPNAAERWMRDAPAKRGMIEFIETIPYKETREYVAAIVRNYFWYSRRLNGVSPKGLNYFWNVYGPPEMPAKLPPTNTPEEPQQNEPKQQNENA